jgi:hypothetical protein
VLALARLHDAYAVEPWVARYDEVYAAIASRANRLVA